MKNSDAPHLLAMRGQVYGVFDGIDDAAAAAAAAAACLP